MNPNTTNDEDQATGSGPQPMDADELRDLITDKLESVINDEDGDVSEVRQHNFDRYYGKPYGNERDGHSSFLTRETFEAIEWAMPSVLRVFTGSDQAVEFTAYSEDDEDAAKLETDVTNHYVQQINNGFLFCHTWVKDILMNPTGYAKAYVEEVSTVRDETMVGLTLDQLNELQQTEGVTVTAFKEYQEDVPPFGLVTLYQVNVQRVLTDRELRLEVVPANELLVDKRWASVELDDCPFVAHRVEKTVSDLVEQGHDYDEIMAAATLEHDRYGDERVSRLFYSDESPEGDGGDDKGASKLVMVHEVSMLADYDGDGIAERRRVLMVGNEIFENEVDDFMPFVACSAILMPHKHVGMSYAEAVNDLQLLSTTLTRQLLDNTYAQTEKRHFLNENAVLPDNSTIDDFLDAEAQLIMVRGNPSEAIMPEVSTPITGELLQVLQHIDDKPQMRTGVAPNLSLDPSVLQQSTMGAFMGALDQASQRLDMLVRVIAEVGYRPIMRKVHTLLRKYVSAPEAMKVRGKWVNFNPQEWPERKRLKVNVGLGFNNKQQKVQLLMGLLGLQKEALATGMTDHAKLHNTLERLVDASGVGSVGSYFIDPAEPVHDPETGEPKPWAPPEPGPDANMILAQAQAQALMAEQDRKMKEAEARAQLEMAKLKAQTQKQEAEDARHLRDFQLRMAEIDMKRRQHDDDYEVETGVAAADIEKANADTRLADARAVQVLRDVGNVGQAAESVPEPPVSLPPGPFDDDGDTEQ